MILRILTIIIVISCINTLFVNSKYIIPNAMSMQSEQEKGNPSENLSDNVNDGQWKDDDAEKSVVEVSDEISERPINDFNYEPLSRGHKKKAKKHLKKMLPALIAIGAMKLLLMKLAIKKLAIITALTFLLSKTSFILSSLVALKHFFGQQQNHQRAEGTKVEVVHIPIRKYEKKKSKEGDSYYEESKFIPVTHYPDRFMEHTTPVNFIDYLNNDHNSYDSNEDHLVEHNYYERNDKGNQNYFYKTRKPSPVKLKNFNLY